MSRDKTGGAMQAAGKAQVGSLAYACSLQRLVFL